MNYIVNIFFSFLATFFGLKTVFYGIYEIQQKNTFGGVSVILFSVFSYALFMVMLLIML